MLAAVILAGMRFLLARANRRRAPFFQPELTERNTWRVEQLLLGSFLTLFAELAFIRWIAVEVMVFAYCKNLALLLCFVGFGLGCALASKPVRWLTGINAFFGLLLVIRLPWAGITWQKLSQNLGAGADVAIWNAGGAWNWPNFLIAALLAAVLFLLLVWIFIPLGQIVSRQMNLAPKPLLGYSWNLLGSLAGILGFLAVSRLMLPPWVWLGTLLVGLALLQSTKRERTLVLSLIVPLVLLLTEPSTRDHFSIWTPYQQIEYAQAYIAPGELRQGYLQVNHSGYQSIVNLSDGFLDRHPGLLKEARDDNPYNLPFRFAKAAPAVLIVGSGTGNDVAAALRHQSVSVDAVEIDPAILTIGKLRHPEHPYDSPRVSVHLTDARAFLKRTAQQYDLVLFGLLDSHTQLSDYANMRIDNFVYTRESFREAKARLKPDGVLFVKFYVDHFWMARRLSEMLQDTFGKPPVVFRAPSSYAAQAVCFVISASDRVEERLAADQRLQAFTFVNRMEPSGPEVPITTDDWPYLYQEERRIPRAYFSLAVIVTLLAVGLYWQIPEAGRKLPSPFFFSMGAGFLLLETQVISRLALYFGTTWQVNGIVIFAVLTALLIANVVVEHTCGEIPRLWNVIALLAALLGLFWLPYGRIPGSPAMVGAVLAVAFTVPVFLAGLLFSSEFRTVKSPGTALGANILGAVLGGLLENLSLIIGMRALLLPAVALYGVAGLALWRRKAGT